MQCPLLPSSRIGVRGDEEGHGGNGGEGPGRPRLRRDRRGAERGAAGPAGTTQTSRNEMCEAGRGVTKDGTPARGEPAI